jgi:hypothetical protein
VGLCFPGVAAIIYPAANTKEQKRATGQLSGFTKNKCYFKRKGAVH